VKPKLSHLVLFTALLLVGLRLFLSAKLGLGDDEAYYWDWSRRLSLSYFDHPGMVAWLIRAGTEVFGQNSFAVRFFGVACSAGATIFLGLLAQKLFDDRVAWLSVFIYVLAPILSIGGILMVPDAPMALAWMAFTYLLLRLWLEPEASVWLWVAAGLVLGFGLVSKYTMVLPALSAVALFAFSNRRNEFKRPRVYILILIASVCCLPVIFWNIEYGWPSLKFHLQERQSGGGGANYNRWLQYFVSQAVALGPALFIACLATLAIAFKRIRDYRWRFIALVSSPPLFIFTAQALFAEFKAHWPAPAYPLLFVGLAALYFEWCELRKRSFWRSIASSLILGYCLLLLILFHVAALEPVIPKLARAFAPDIQWDPKFDPTNDLYGWPEAITEVNRFRDQEAKEHGERPFLSSSRYQLVAQLAFASQEIVVRVSATKDQYTFTQTKEFLDSYNGKSSVFVTDQRFDRDPRTDQRFETCEQRPDFEFRRGEELARIFHIWICRGYKSPAS
jgi:uncharacterized membrane protein